MPRLALLMIVLVVPQQEAMQPSQTGAGNAASDGPNYTANGELKMPERYREWIFLTSGVDMSYSPNAAMAGHSMFDNVFVNPSAYRAFLETGTWPDKTAGAGDPRIRGGEFDQQTRACPVARDHGDGGPCEGRQAGGWVGVLRI